MNNDQIPLEFLNFSIPQYPSLNTKKNFEAYFFEYFQNQEFNTSLKYIPIQWTNYLVKQNYGRDIQDLNNYLKLNLKSEEKYFTIVQYSGGPLIELENTLIFSMGGTMNTKLGKNSKVIPLPLLYDSNLKKADLEKKYIASYIGRPTHKIRTKLEDRITSNEKFYIKNITSMNSSISKENLELFEKLIKESYFSICPRGYGPTSFRLYESIQMGTVPIYISDKFFLPYIEFLDWSEFAILLKSRKISSLPRKLNNLIESGEYFRLKDSLDKVSEKYFNFLYMSKYIKSIVEKL
tara:strand:- start:102 stop:980 length:879 start_codon:yes stop_codon:yes gene_type:complete